MVVVIEEAEEQPQVITVSNAKKRGEEEAAESSSVIGKDASEGFETASEGGDSTVSGGDNDDDDVSSEQQQQQQDDDNQQTRSLNGESEQRQRTVAAVAAAAAKEDSYEDALNDDQLKQKALAQANDAKVEGNELFKDGKYEDALLKYELALQVAPEVPKNESPPQAAPERPMHEPTQEAEKPKHEPAPQVAPELTPLVELRSICHSNRAVCFLKLEKYEETVKECSKALELNPVYVKALVRRGEAYEKLERYDEAISDMKKILELDPSNYQARKNIVRLEPLAREKMEKMKDEMIGKLKDMGNSILGRFGMSVDNFKSVQDPKTGSYSISFQR